MGFIVPKLGINLERSSNSDPTTTRTQTTSTNRDPTKPSHLNCAVSAILNYLTDSASATETDAGHETIDWFPQKVRPILGWLTRLLKVRVLAGSRRSSGDADPWHTKPVALSAFTLAEMQSRHERLISRKRGWESRVMRFSFKVLSAFLVLGRTGVRDSDSIAGTWFPKPSRRDPADFFRS